MVLNTTARLGMWPLERDLIMDGVYGSRPTFDGGYNPMQLQKKIMQTQVQVHLLSIDFLFSQRNMFAY